MKSAIIIGSNRGIGLELCRQYLKKDYQVTAVCRKPSSELESLGVNIISGIDVNSSDSLNELRKKLDDKSFDVLFHNAGIMRQENLQNMNKETIKEQLEVNALAPLMTIHTLLDCLSLEAKVGVLTSRMGSITDNDSGGSYGYRMSKCALNAAIKSLSIDLKEQGVFFAILHPGYVKTDMTNNNGLIETDESVSGLLKIMDQLNANNSGTFWHTNGEVLSW